MKPDQLLQEAADIFKERNAAYGNNSKNYAGAMAALFPHGIVALTPEDHERLHLLMLLIVKVSRYCNNFEKGGHDDSLADISVYAAMLRSVDKGIEEGDRVPL